MKEMAGVSEEQQSEFFNVVKEIMCLHRERRDLLAALTPGVSVWKRRGPGEETLVRRLAGRDYTPPVQGQVQTQVQEMETESASTAEQLGRYFDSIVQDAGDLGHRMLSMAYAVVRPDNGAALSSYMADELVNSTSALMHACKELYEDTDYNEQAAEEEEEQKNTFLDLCDKFLREPLNYENELALVVTREEVEEYEQEVEKQRKMAEELRLKSMAHVKQWEERQKQRDRYEKEEEMGNVKEYELRWAKAKAKEKEEKKKKETDQEEENNKEKATMEYLKTGMEVSRKLFALHRNGWETGWGSKSVRCGGFRDTSKQNMHLDSLLV